MFEMVSRSITYDSIFLVHILSLQCHYDIVCSFVVKKAHTQKFIALRIDTLVITCTSVKIKMWIMALKRNN